MIYRRKVENDKARITILGFDVYARSGSIEVIGLGKFTMYHRIADRISFSFLGIPLYRRVGAIRSVLGVKWVGRCASSRR